ncbi:MAG: hypothetical protein B6V02_02055 [Thermoprotei archaeon ex4572_64]|nr:MAG: hypothetical protein B6V02_02055 [Thermoprotei archaeon ex4572_64]
MKIYITSYDLELTFYPSFIITMFKKVSNYYWIKSYGYFKGLIVKQIGDVLEIEGCNNSEVISKFLGIWYEPEKFIINVTSSLRDNTNVIRWVQKILQLCNEDVKELKKINIEYVGKSYQLKQLVEIIDQYFNVKEDKDIWNLRKQLLKLKFVGPKVVDAYLLFTGKSTFIAPSDKHYVRFSKRIGLFKYSTLPDKKYCLKFTCEDCPKSHTCLTGLSYKHLSNLSSWIQTVSYVYDRMYCSRGACKKCELQKICKSC